MASEASDAPIQPPPQPEPQDQGDNSFSSRRAERSAQRTWYRVVIPVFKRKNLGIQPLTRLTPEVEIQGDKYVVMTPQLAGIPIKDLGPVAGNLSEYRGEIVSALDFLITGF